MFSSTPPYAFMAVNRDNFTLHCYRRTNETDDEILLNKLPLLLLLLLPLPLVLQSVVGFGFLCHVIATHRIQRQFFPIMHIRHLLIHCPWTLQRSALEYPSGYAFLRFHG
jgi:hypothetical protein